MSQFSSISLSDRFVSYHREPGPTMTHLPLLQGPYAPRWDGGSLVSQPLDEVKFKL